MFMITMIMMVIVMMPDLTLGSFVVIPQDLMMLMMITISMIMVMIMMISLTAKSIIVKPQKSRHSQPFVKSD